AHLLAGEFLLASEHPGTALDQGDAATERGPGLGELTANRAATEHDHALRDVLRGRSLAVVPGSNRLEAGDRRHRGGAAGGDDHGAIRRQQVVADPHLALALEPAAAAE